MATKTRAAVLVEPYKIEVREFPLPEIGDDDGLLRVEITGVCGADWAAYEGQPGRWGVPPIILGHETVGRVDRLGANAAKRWGVKEGDRVVVEEYVPCGYCECCLSGHYSACPDRMYGFTSLNLPPSLWGGYSEYLYLHPRALLHKLAPEVPTPIAPLFLPLSNGIRWVQQAGGVGIGSTVLILGPGNQGLCCVIAAKEAGATCIIVAGRSVDTHRLALAREFGAHHTIDVDGEDIGERVRELTDGRMPETVVNVTANAPSASNLAFSLAARWGKVVMAGMIHGLTEGVDTDAIVKKELTVQGVIGRSFRELKKALRLLESGKYPFEKQCTHHFSIEETEKAIRTVGRQGDPEAIHVAVGNPP